MSKTVFILGAGASKEAGAPLMNEFLDFARDIYSSRKIKNDYYHDFEKVFKAISELQKIHSKSILDIYNIESVFAIFEMGRLIEKLPGLTGKDQISDLIASTKKLIYATLDRSIPLIINSQNKTPSPNSTYQNLIQLLLKYEKKDSEKPSIISFNYDLAVDYAIYFNNYNLNYCIDNLNKEKSIKILKLHGSLNWFSNSEKIAPFEFIEIMKWYNFDIIGETEIYLDLLDKVKKNNNKIVYKSKKIKVEPAPFIIPPTWNKTEANYNIEIRKVWNQAAKELSEAENIFIIGYSLPETDYFFKYLYALGTEGEQIIKNIWVFNPDSEVENKFKNLLGIGVINRFKFYNMKFSEAVEYINKEIFKESFLKQKRPKVYVN
jgi:hypothetical protein